jgi:asparagine synthase (glutamine-hydrolysing)
VLVFNGEIFNHVELRAELEARGRVFRTRSDTEVILHAWEVWGERCLERFNGQWAFALWHPLDETLILARDRVGVRPLHVCEREGVVLFASEVKALMQHPLAPRAIDPAGLAETFTFWAPRAPRTLFEGISELPPGTVRVWRRGVAEAPRRWWRPRFSVPPQTPRADTPRRLLDALREATRLRMVRSDVPVGAYLSGGIDSAVVAALARASVGDALRTFSLRFEDAAHDEGSYQQRMVRALGSEHHEVVARRADIARVFPEVIAHTERAVLRTGAAALSLLSSLVRASGMKVVVTGEGSDELLGGYDLFREARVRRFWARDPSSTLRPRLFERLYPWLARSPQATRGMALAQWAHGLDAPDAPTFSHDPRWRSARALQRLFAPSVRAAAAASGEAVAQLIAELPDDFGRWHPLERAQYLEIETLLAPYILSSQGDRVLMAHSVEGRFPFLDAEVIELACAMHPNEKLRALNEKDALKIAARGLVPDEIVRRPKQPYRAPDAVCFVAPDAPEYVRELLAPEALRAAELFDVTAVGALYAKCQRRVRDDGPAAALSNADDMALVGVLSAQLAHHLFVATPPAEPRTAVFGTVIER